MLVLLIFVIHIISILIDIELLLIENMFRLTFHLKLVSFKNTLSFFYKKFFIRNFGKMNFKFKSTIFFLFFLINNNKTTI